jgi:hypothetical protein
MRWFLSTESVGVRRLSLAAGIVSALYELGYCYMHPPEGQWGFWASVALLCSFYFLCAWVPIRIVAWIVSGFVSDARKSQTDPLPKKRHC